MAGAAVFAVFVVMMLVLAAFVIRFSVKLSRERNSTPPDDGVRPRHPGGSRG
jgi:hypothetical protein